MSTGKIVQVMGPVVDVAFESGELPEIYTALEIKQKDERVICEVQQHLGESTVRTVSMGSTDGLSRGMDVKDLTSELIIFCLNSLGLVPDKIFIADLGPIPLIVFRFKNNALSDAFSKA